MKRTTSSVEQGYEPPPKKPKVTMIEAADRADKYLSPAQPGRVHLSKIYWHLANRGGQGIMPMHVQDVAFGICKSGTSKRRYKSVRLVVVPEGAVEKTVLCYLKLYSLRRSSTPYFGRGSKAQGPTRRSTIPAKGGRP